MINRCLAFSKRSIFISGLFLLTSLDCYAASPKADLSVSFLPANSVKVYQPRVYTIKVSNIGNANASNVTLRVNLPKTANSPVAYIMGTASNLDQRCSISGTIMNCQLGSLAKNKSTNVSLTLSLAHAEKILKLDSSTASSSQEHNYNNNSASYTPILTYDSIAVSESFGIVNEHCTGSNLLSSFLECVYAPSSISQHSVDFLVNGQIITEDPSVTGVWSQNSPLGNQELHFEYIENNQVTAIFNGKAVNTSCFEGVMRFPQSPAYVSPYKVCF